MKLDPPTTLRRLAVTGADGFVGWHLRCRIKAMSPQTEFTTIDRDDFADPATLRARLRGVDGVVHLAGANRGSDEEVHATNVTLATEIVAALRDVAATPTLVYVNTIHADRSSAYGRSKKQAAHLLTAWGDRVGAPVTDLRLPNLFGECGRPHYNSAVATFCHELARGESSYVDPAGSTELLHVQAACALVLAALESPVVGTQRVEGTQLGIPEVYGRLQRLAAGYHDARLPELIDRLDLQLFNQLRTAMFPARYPLPLAGHVDSRGMFAEAARGYGATQTSYSITKLGVTRGEHFHLDKVERFVVVSGSAVIRLRKLFSRDVVSFEVSGDHPVAVDMPPLFAHDITNIGKSDLVTLFWANDHFDAASPDTYPEPVAPRKTEQLV